MAHDAVIERYLDGVELVRSRGDPERRRVCVMALVAHLAGEAHGDRPAVASPAVAGFARAVNDAMDRPTRQRLVPFAPRISGTADGLDAERQAVLHAALFDTLLPAAVQDLRVAAGSGVRGGDAEAAVRLAGELAAAEPDAYPRIVQDPAWDHALLIGPLRAAVSAHRSGHAEQHAEAVARILIAAVTGLARPSRRAWYWNLAVDVLDRLCEVGADARDSTRAPNGEDAAVSA
ncbi:hypothetical protein SAMN05216241_1142 [Limimonas halophila]|uniref:Uncharacterized protein n=1 Tax=Limimonas halophila TaxID=1082479 RepID=A0A1G7UF92_9PROT|nr:hypothetical protein [Limimonas halophila]SDG45739.1 hypothetical protein SAMN05216241_1142 [Limimonas halophila]